MGILAPRLCRCGRLYRGRCPTCTLKRDRARGTASARGYDATWAAYAADWLRHFPWCGQRVDGQLHAEHSRCVQQGERVRAGVVDHIRALRDGGARLDPLNHQSLCVSCNVRKR